MKGKYADARVFVVMRCFLRRKLFSTASAQKAMVAAGVIGLVAMFPSMAPAGPVPEVSPPECVGNCPTGGGSGRREPARK